MQDMKKEDDTKDYPSTDDFRKEDLIKAGKIMLYSIIAAGVTTAILYYLPF